MSGEGFVGCGTVSSTVARRIVMAVGRMLQQAARLSRAERLYIADRLVVIAHKLV